MNPQLHQTSYSIPTMWGANRLTRQIRHRADNHCELYLKGGYIGIEWDDGSITMSGVTYYVK
jgi:hypothetical protein